MEVAMSEAGKMSEIEKAEFLREHVPVFITCTDGETRIRFDQSQVDLLFESVSGNNIVAVLRGRKGKKVYPTESITEQIGA
jgi:hypothetical protein